MKKQPCLQTLQFAFAPMTGFHDPHPLSALLQVQPRYQATTSSLINNQYGDNTSATGSLAIAQMSAWDIHFGYPGGSYR